MTRCGYTVKGYLPGNGPGIPPTCLRVRLLRRVMRRRARTAQMNAYSLLEVATVTFRTREPFQSRSR